MINKSKGTKHSLIRKALKYLWGVLGHHSVRVCLVEVQYAIPRDCIAPAIRGKTVSSSATRGSKGALYGRNPQAALHLSQILPGGFEPVYTPYRTPKVQPATGARDVSVHTYLRKRVTYWERRNRGYTQKWTSLKTQLETAARGGTCITAGMP